MSATAVAKNWFQTIQEAKEKKSLLHRVREYHGFVPVEYETQEFVVKTAMNGYQLLKALELRHEIFVQEWQGRRAFHRMDVDGYDFTADHLLIIDKSSDDVVGTYRLLSSHFTQSFYSSEEFDLTQFLRVPAVKLEMGRACIQSQYRNGSTIDLLWKGLTQYIQATKTEYLFGCSSIKSLDAKLMSRVYQTLSDQGSWSDDYGAKPTASYAMPGFSRDGAEPLSPQQKRDLYPPLLRSYLHAGARVHGVPAMDRAFCCTDLLTILDWKQLNKRFLARFAG